VVVVAGPIPETIGQVTSLRKLDLSCNDLTGAWFSLTYWCFHRWRLSRDGFCVMATTAGAIPTTIRHLVNLEWLILNDNELNGAGMRSSLLVCSACTTHASHALGFCGFGGGQASFLRPSGS
jgi:hypothetical protein